MEKQVVIQAIETLRDINNLTHSRLNIYTDDAGIEYFLDKYGFHTNTQINNNKLINLINRLYRYYDIIHNLANVNEVVGRKTKSYIRKILSDEHLTTQEQLAKINDYLNTTPDPEVHILTELHKIKDLYRNKV